MDIQDSIAPVTNTQATVSMKTSLENTPNMADGIVTTAEVPYGDTTISYNTTEVENIPLNTAEEQISTPSTNTSTFEMHSAPPLPTKILKGVKFATTIATTEYPKYSVPKSSLHNLTYNFADNNSATDIPSILPSTFKPNQNAFIEFPRDTINISENELTFQQLHTNSNSLSGNELDSQHASIQVVNLTDLYEPITNSSESLYFGIKILVLSLLLVVWGLLLYLTIKQGMDLFLFILI